MKFSNYHIGLVASLPLMASAVFAQTEPNIEFDILPRPTAEQEFAEYIEYLVEVAEPRTVEERAADADVKRKFGDAMVIDGLFVGAPGFPAGFSDEQYEEAVQHSIDSQYNILSATISNGPPEDTPDVVTARMEKVNAYWAERPDRYIQVRTVDDMKRAQREGKLGHNGKASLASCTTTKA
jgi:hypothetical protein